MIHTHTHTRARAHTHTHIHTHTHTDYDDDCGYGCGCDCANNYNCDVCGCEYQVRKYTHTQKKHFALVGCVERCLAQNNFIKY